MNPWWFSGAGPAARPSGQPGPAPAGSQTRRQSTDQVIGVSLSWPKSYGAPDHFASAALSRRVAAFPPWSTRRAALPATMPPLRCARCVNPAISPSLRRWNTDAIPTRCRPAKIVYSQRVNRDSSRSDQNRSATRPFATRCGLFLGRCLTPAGVGRSPGPEFPRHPRKCSECGHRTGYG